MIFKRLPNPEAHKKFIISFCNKGDINVKFVKGLKVASASLSSRTGKALVLLKEPIITDLEDGQWDWDAYHEASHLLPELRFTYVTLSMCKTELERTIFNIIADNMCERARHGKYKGRDRAMYMGRYEYVMKHIDVVMQRKHPSMSALYVEDFRDRTLWQGFFPPMKGMEGADFYLPGIEKLDISSRIPLIMQAQDADDFYELVKAICELAKQQPPPKQEEQQDDNSTDDANDNKPDDTDDDSDRPDGDDSQADGGGSEEDTDPEEQEDEEASGENAGRNGEEDDDESGSDSQQQCDKESDSSEGGTEETDDTSGSEGGSDSDGYGDDSDTVDSDRDGDGDPNDSDTIPGGDDTAGGDGTGSACSWEPIDDGTLDIADPDRQLKADGAYVPQDIQLDEYTPIGNYQLTRVDNLSVRNYHLTEISSQASGTTLTRSIQRYLRCMTKDTYQYGMKRGRIHAKHISRLFTADRDPKIFKQRQSHILRTDTAVSLLLDCSSSMESTRYILAAAAALVVSDTLRELGIVHEILGFTEHCRVISIYEFKEFDEILNHEKLLFRLSKNVGMHYTPDAESIVYAGNRLIVRPEENKVLMVLCDGQPQGNFKGSGEWYLKQVCDVIQDSGLMKLIGIGINLEDVKDYYKNYAVVRNLQQDLEPVMIKVLAESLL